jgi:hypothetical protein
LHHEIVAPESRKNYTFFGQIQPSEAYRFQAYLILRDANYGQEIDFSGIAAVVGLIWICAAGFIAESARATARKCGGSREISLHASRSKMCERHHADRALTGAMRCIHFEASDSSYADEEADLWVFDVHALHVHFLWRSLPCFACLLFTQRGLAPSR